MDMEKIVSCLSDIENIMIVRQEICPREELQYWIELQVGVAAAIAFLKKQETVEHACEILRANGWKETEPICSECEAVHVVLCKDCKNSGLDSSGINGYWCSAHTEWHDADWFCADGKRKD